MGQAGGVSVEFHLFDAEYVRKLADGDAATESHFSAYFERFILTKLRARKVSVEMAEDVCQETLLRVLKSLRQGSGVSQPERFGAFVNAVSNNVFLELTHKQSRHVLVDEDTPEPVDKAAGAETKLITEERKQMVAAVLEELSPKEREILRLVFFEEADRRQISEQFQVDPDYLRVLLHRAKSKFQLAYSRRQRAFQRTVALFFLCNAMVLKITME
ncbi:MAG: sigma-70 family RNA polymerase sigma factor [Bryobacteraceae bacterium]|jgi:RNA polymerase sigma-70 factor (ECF subfamily)